MPPMRLTITLAMTPTSMTTRILSLHVVGLLSRDMRSYQCGLQTRLGKRSNATFCCADASGCRPLRRFYWHELMLWPRDIPEHAIVALSAKDDLVPAELVQVLYIYI